MNNKNTAELLRSALQDTDYILNQYDEVIRKTDYVELAYVRHDQLLFNQRCGKREMLYIIKLLKNKRSECYYE